MVKTPLINMAVGAAVVILGIAASAASYAVSGDAGGVFIVAFGALAFGAWRFLVGLSELLIGLYQLSRGTVSASSVAPQPASAAPLAGVGLATAGGTLTTDPFGAAAPTIVGALLIVQAVVRAGFVAASIARFGIAHLVGKAFENPVGFLFSPLFLPAALAIAGLIAGELALRRAPSARGFGLVFCVVTFLCHLVLDNPYSLVAVINLAFAAVCFLMFLNSSYYRAQSERL